MSVREEEEIRGDWIPNNVLQGKRILGFRPRSFIEAAIWCFLIWKGVSLIPFVTRVQWIITICLCIGAIFVNLVGVKDMTLSEVCLNFVHCKRTARVYHLRSIDYAKKEKRNNNGQITTQTNESAAERFIRIVKEKYEELATDDEENGSTSFEDSEEAEERED